MSLLIQLAFYETLVDWREINEQPRKYDAVSAADIRRVVDAYFTTNNRSVATYTRSASEGTGVADSPRTAPPPRRQSASEESLP